MIASRGKAAVLLAAVFVAGLVIGFGITFVARGYLPPPRRHRGADEFVARLTHDLHLSDAQRDSVQAILARRRASMDSLWREVGPRFETLQRGVRSDIRAQLDTAQQRKFVEMTKRFDAKRGAGSTHAR